MPNSPPSAHGTEARASHGPAQAEGATTPNGLASPRPRVAWWRTALPLGLGAALVAFVLGRIEWRAFVRHLARVSYPAFAGFMVLFVALLIAADSLATSYIYRRSDVAVRYRDFCLARAASYLPSALNHHVGQAWLTYYLSRVYGVSLGRVAGATILSYASWGGCVLALGSVALLFSEQSARWLVLPLGLGVSYLVLLALRPRKLAQQRVLAPLFEAGVSGHLAAMALRLPHMAVLFVGSWLPFWFFGVEVPLSAALRTVPIIMVAVTLPLTPQGFGTRDLLAAQFFAQFVAVEGASREARLAAVAAATTTQAVVITIIGVTLGALSMPHALRRLKQVEASTAARQIAPLQGEG